ncbi:CoA ester lyase [Pectobacterium brasiliense]|uniref:HpcH/HpaI aldolase/citrate lyase family protein n=1 Tax=Pectobacterium brasiliense TaxID=180957 RepID=UPI001CE0A52B|nr:CoA ester lyase [Pectobacterium brasiliense]MCA5921053.1 CoA ester lyase [Pectobacterium brasiliense]MCA5927173.1 CoA ester lyase [Pectobacterium brasiliense]MCA5937032.1 CoA ester lyase [Pectobacterium brasiliense]MCA5940940.1 CoA ester lyase [Pectobacterium brasiliense]MCA5943739.1 CoA ester lyase [Pectobacterium brasiliense]
MEHAKTYLFVPGNAPHRFQQAVCCGADAVIFDLEDAVHPDEKNQARENIIQWDKNDTPVSEINCKKYIRLNKFGSVEFSEDIEFLNKLNNKEKLRNNVPAKHKKDKWEIVLPKIESAKMLHDAREMINRNRSETVNIIAIIETAQGLHHAEEICAAGVERVAFGSLDFSLDIHCDQSLYALLYARSRIVLASRLADLPPPIDCVNPDFTHHDRVLADALHARSLGFSAKLCIHPSQIDAVQRAFATDRSKIDWAKQVLKAAEHSYAFQINGEMVDLPVIEQARQLLRAQNVDN